MKNTLQTLLVVALLGIGCGCVGTERQSECHGPWTPINATQQVHANG